MEKQFCEYCGEHLSEGCDCARVAAEEQELWLENYYDSPETHAGWTNEDLCFNRTQEQ